MCVCALCLLCCAPDLLKQYLSTSPVKEVLKVWLSFCAFMVLVVSAWLQRVTWKKERRFMSSIHLSTFSGPAFIQRSARLVNKMNNLWLTALVLHYPNSKNSNSCAISRWHSLRHTQLLEMLFLLSWDTQGVCSGYVTRTHLLALHCIESRSKKTLDFEDDELSTVRFTVTKNLKCTIFVSCIFLSRSSQLQAVHKNAGGC